MNAAGTPKNLKPAKQAWNLKGGTSIYVPRELVAAVLEYARSLDLAAIICDPESNLLLDNASAERKFLEENIDQIEELALTDSPADRTEDEWVAEITGLPVGFDSENDDLPAEIVEAITEIKKSQAQTKEEVANEIINQRHDPAYGTHEWIDMMEAPPNRNGWTWQKYLKMVQEEARDGFPDAKAELKILKANGWLEPNFRGGGHQKIGWDDKPRKGFERRPDTKQQAKLAKRAANAAKSGAKIV